MIPARFQSLDAVAAAAAKPKRIFGAAAESRAAGHSAPADSCAAIAVTVRDCSVAADLDFDACDPIPPRYADWAAC